MAPIPVWSGNLRLSLVLVPVRLYPATSTEGTIAFRMIHEPSGKPIKYVKEIETDRGFEEVAEEDIIKGYEHAKGHHVLINPEEIDALKLEVTAPTMAVRPIIATTGGNASASKSGRAMVGAS